MRFIIETPKMKELQGLLECLGEGALIDIGPDGWNVRAMDPAHTARVDLHIEPRAFLMYDGEEERISLDLKRVKTMLANIPSVDAIVIEGDAVQLRFEAGFLKWRIKMDGDPSPVSDPPRCDFTSEAEIKVGDLRLTAKAANTMAEQIVLHAKGPVLTVTAKGDVDDLEVNPPPIKETKEAEGVYPLEFVLGIVKALPDGPLKLRFADDKPLSLEATAWKNALQVEYLVAPRILGGD